jgi:hypothetical protein
VTSNKSAGHRGVGGAGFVAALMIAHGCDPQFQFSVAEPSLEGGADVTGITDAALAAPDAAPIPGGPMDAAREAGRSRCPETACPSGLTCVAGACLECAIDAECAGTRLRCGTSGTFRNLCVECNTKTDCGPKQDCNVVTGHCVDTCSEINEACSQSGYACNDDKRMCVTCLTKANCPSSQAPNCDPQLGVCVACFSSAQCKDPKRGVCDRRDGQCYGCLRGSDCASGTCDPAMRQCAP